MSALSSGRCNNPAISHATKPLSMHEFDDIAKLRRSLYTFQRAKFREPRTLFASKFVKLRQGGSWSRLDTSASTLAPALLESKWLKHAISPKGCDGLTL
jgi:hypothetical protein